MKTGTLRRRSAALLSEYEDSKEKYRLAYEITGLGGLMKDLARQVIDLQDKVDNQAMQLQTLELKLLQLKLQHLKGQTLNRGDTE